MRFYSTNNPSIFVDFETAVRRGLAPDRGLYMPETIPVLPGLFFDMLPDLSLPQIAREILYPYVGGAILEDELQSLCEEAFSFDLPLVEVKPGLYSLELYHGPTLAFKDFGARFMARILGHINKAAQTKNTILVATSGDTGSAVASGFYNVPNTEVVILFPKGKVSRLQEQQMTTLGNNINALAIEGTFDDCQHLVKEAFLDAEISTKFGLTSANSINLARLLPQMIYYFYAVGQLQEKGLPVVFSVPSGNYGNLTAGIIASKMGLPIDHFIAASNANSIVPDYLKTGQFEPKPSIETISNAMDVGNPSNFVRLEDIFEHSFEKFHQHLRGYSFSDDDTRETILQLWSTTGYLADPHGAIGYRALADYLNHHPGIGVFLETAHPIKFRESVEPLIGKSIDAPDALLTIMAKQGRSKTCSANYAAFKTVLVELLS